MVSGLSEILHPRQWFIFDIKSQQGSRIVMDGLPGIITAELGKAFETDDFDVIDQRHEANDRTLCGCVEITSRGVPEWGWSPHFPGGTVQSKVIDSSMAETMELWAQAGHHGSDFLVGPFLKQHPEYTGCGGCCGT